MWERTQALSSASVGLKFWLCHLQIMGKLANSRAPLILTFLPCKGGPSCAGPLWGLEGFRVKNACPWGTSHSLCPASSTPLILVLSPYLREGLRWVCEWIFPRGKHSNFLFYYFKVVNHYILTKWQIMGGKVMFGRWDACSPGCCNAVKHRLYSLIVMEKKNIKILFTVLLSFQRGTVGSFHSCPCP